MVEYTRTVGFQQDRERLFRLLGDLTKAVNRLADAAEALTPDTEEETQ